MYVIHGIEHDFCDTCPYYVDCLIQSFIYVTPIRCDRKQMLDMATKPKNNPNKKDKE